MKLIRETIVTIERKGIINDGVDPLDLTWGLMPAVVMVNASVNQMQEILEAAEEIQERQRVANILLWLDTVFLIVPFVGTALKGTVGTVMTNMARVLTGLGDAYTVGRGLYDAITDPSPGAGLVALAGFAVGKVVWTRSEAAYVSQNVKLLDATGFGPVMMPFTVFKEHFKQLFPEEPVEPV